ncbi:MAG: A/G-specific adenine glycosylase [Gammaproteobacteria bacterium]|nr:A/G-specific adenine glycosylase [Gammaproteobacteria bacterium]
MAERTRRKRTATAADFSARLLAWFDCHGRHDLPWQRERSPYRVWLSEIMLQQTQVGTVIPYFERFVAAFPDVAALAAAPIDSVLHHWTGLGYYARARNLHRTARLLAAQYGGQFPAALDELTALPGIGRSTAGAIAAIAFGRRAAILDGNVKRVLARHGAIAGWPGQTDISRALWEIAERFTPTERVADYTQAIMDLGATLCTRTRPACDRCPVRADCRAHATGVPEQYPGRKPKAATPIRAILFLILRNPAGAVLLEQRPPTGIWGGLWSFPECAPEADIASRCDALGYRALGWQAGAARRHVFSHYRLDYTPVEVTVAPDFAVADGDTRRWVLPASPDALGLSAPVKALLAELGDAPVAPAKTVPRQP